MCPCHKGKHQNPTSPAAADSFLGRQEFLLVFRLTGIQEAQNRCQSRCDAIKRGCTCPQGTSSPISITLMSYSRQYPLQSLAVTSPFSAYEIEIVTKFDKSAPPLRGRMSLPRDPRKTEEVVLVFAEGEKAVEAREAGAKFVGGDELIPKVS
jgi:hypothetical protein